MKKEIGLLVIISSKIYIFALIWQMFPQGKQFQQNVKEMIELTMNTTSFFMSLYKKCQKFKYSYSNTLYRVICSVESALFHVGSKYYIRSSQRFLIDYIKSEAANQMCS